MGRAIEDRGIRCAGWWEPHLRCTREFLERGVPASKKVAVFGAGRLLDLNLKRLLERCEVVHLFDADPGCMRAWRAAAGKEFGKRVVPRIVDLTECLDEWSHGLARSARVGTLAEYLTSREAPIPSWSGEGFEGIISLNMLGQIPLYWRDRVLTGKSELSDVEAEALMRCMGRLQAAHAEGIAQLQPTWAAIITDTEYYFYDVDQPEWRVESAVFDEKTRDMLRLRPESRTPRSESWLWHVAPQFIESDVEGEIHRVEARFLTSFKR